MFKRVNSDVVPFSINSPAGNRYAFGTTDVSNDIDVNYNENIKKGFGTGPNEFPELEDFNALMFTGSYLAAYLYQAGIPEWNDKQKYYINSIAMGGDGNIYRSLAGTEETPNTNNNPTLAGSVSWKSIFSEYALKNGSNQNLFKVKDAVADDEAINKKQLDDMFSQIDISLSDFTGANQSKSQNGYQKLPGGLFIQWGYSSTNQIIFPISFPSNILIVLAQGQLNTTNAMAATANYISSMSTTGCTLLGVGYAFYYIAIGY